MIGAMQHVARVLACLDPDGASPEEWDEILHAQAVTLRAVYDWVTVFPGAAKPFFPRSVDPKEAMERAVAKGLLTPEFLDGGKHFFNVNHEPLCSCEPSLDADVLCHRINCRLLTYRTRTAYVFGANLATEAHVFSFLMRAPDILVADRIFSDARQILWCPRNHVITLASNTGPVVRPGPWLSMGLWARQLGNGVVAIGVPPAEFNSCDPGPYTEFERGIAIHKAAQAEFAARPTFT